MFVLCDVSVDSKCSIPPFVLIFLLEWFNGSLWWFVILFNDDALFLRVDFNFIFMPYSVIFS